MIVVIFLQLVLASVCPFVHPSIHKFSPVLTRLSVINFSICLLQVSTCGCAFLYSFNILYTKRCFLLSLVFFFISENYSGIGSILTQSFEKVTHFVQGWPGVFKVLWSFHRQNKDEFSSFCCYPVSFSSGIALLKF